MTSHFANLTNGTLCAPPGASRLRIQSTWCEQKRWDDVLWTLSPEFYYSAAHGEQIVVHDQSELVRLTRAQWQGLSWARYAMRAAWGLPAEPEYSRSGHNVTPYWQQAWHDCSRRTRRLVGYYTKYCAGSAVDVRACSCVRVPAVIGADSRLVAA